MAISRELTQKVKRTDSDEEDEEDEENVDEILLNNKEGNIKTDSEIDDFIKLCRKFHDKKPQTKRENIERDGISDEIILEKEKETACHDEKNNTSQARSDMNSKLCSNEKSSTLQVNASDTKSKLRSNEKSGTSNGNTNNTKSKSCNNEKSSNLSTNTNDIKDKIKREKNKRKKKESFISDVDATSEHNNKKFKSQDKNEMFDSKSSKKEKSKVNLKMQKVKNKCKVNSKIEKHKEENEDYSPNLEFENSKQKPILDSPLEETTSRGYAQKRSDLTNLKTIANNTIQEPASISHEAEIDPKKYVNIKPKHLKTQLPDMTTGGDEDSEQEEETHKIMSEAFADDDVVEEFRKEKEEEVRKQNFK